jgi:medium-chain acyl-[acyl-carrier-protein] hydrolase
MAETNGKQRTVWLAGYRPNPQAGLRLFCFPYSGASSAIYSQWPRTLPPAIEACLVELPGHGARIAEIPFTQLAPLVQAAARELGPYFDMPFAFFGHSMGALVAFELARLLHRKHCLIPAHLFVSGHAAPQVTVYESPIHGLPDREFLEALRKLNGMSRGELEHAELMELLLPTLRADFELCETFGYQDGPRLPCPISACGGLQDAMVSRTGLKAWRSQTSAGFSLHLFPGDHFYLHEHRMLLLQTIARALVAEPVCT